MPKVQYSEEELKAYHRFLVFAACSLLVPVWIGIAWSKWGIEGVGAAIGISVSTVMLELCLITLACSQGSELLKASKIRIAKEKERDDTN